MTYDDTAARAVARRYYPDAEAASVEEARTIGTAQGAFTAGARWQYERDRGADRWLAVHDAEVLRAAAADVFDTALPAHVARWLEARADAIEHGTTPEQATP